MESRSATTHNPAFPALLAGFAGAAVLLLAAGCGGDDAPQTSPATGQVTLNGAPVAGADVTFVPVDTSEDATPAQAITDNQGRFEAVSVFSQGRTTRAGVRPGSYLVGVVKYSDAKIASNTLTSPPKNTLPQKYESPQASGLKAEVAAEGENHFVFELEN